MCRDQHDISSSTQSAASACSFLQKESRRLHASKEFANWHIMNEPGRHGFANRVKSTPVKL